MLMAKCTIQFSISQYDKLLHVRHTVLLPQTVALASGMMDKLDQPGHYTLFAPTNEAFDGLSPGYLERIMEDKAVIAGTL